MKLCTIVLTGVALAAGALGARAAFQEGMPMARPGPEHEVLKHMAGTWDAEVAWGPSKEKGTMTSKLSLSDLWIVSDYAGTMMGSPFSGHQVFGYDTSRKNYISIWVDSASTEMGISEGPYDAATKTMTLTGEGVDPMSGAKITMINKIVVQDADHHVLSMYMGSADAPSVMTITYVRKK